MKRSEMLLDALDPSIVWDVIVIGAGATGLWTAIDALTRGLKTLVLEKGDIACCTSSRSTKLAHGGLRYLKKGQLKLVYEALTERELLEKNAPHLVHDLPFFIPSYSPTQSMILLLGLTFYDLLSNRPTKKPLSKKEAKKCFPSLDSKRLRGGYLYTDGQFDDTRLAIDLALTIEDLGGTIVNYMPITAFHKQNKKLSGVRARDLESMREYDIKGKVIINATGVFADKLRSLDDPLSKSLIKASRGTHIVVDRSFHKSDKAMIFPSTSDNRVLFVIPWLNHTLIGTTDVATTSIEEQPTASSDEIDYILNECKKHLFPSPTKADILSHFSGLRPLISKSSTQTKNLSREHHIEISSSGLITIAGGKWTTARKMGEDVINSTGLTSKKSQTKSLRLHGYGEDLDPIDPWSTYGVNQKGLLALLMEDPLYSEPLDPEFSYLKGEVIWATRYEMARKVEDILARRTRILFLNAKKSCQLAPLVAKLMAKELNKDQTWQDQQVASFLSLAKKAYF